MTLTFIAQDLVDVIPIGERRYRSRQTLDNGTGAVFGGQLLALALAAAQRESPDWPAYSLSGNFLRAGRVDEPIELAVEQVHDGRRFVTRRILASQSQRPIFDLICSFHEKEAGLVHLPEHQLAAQAPEDLPSLSEFAQAHAASIPPAIIKHYIRPFPVELRMTQPETLISAAKSLRRDYWVRVPSAAGIDKPAIHQCLLALISDYWLPSSASALLAASGLEAVAHMASLAHTLSLHASVRTDDWLFYQTETVWAGEGRALAQGQIRHRNGGLVATAMQEFLLRLP